MEEIQLLVLEAITSNQEIYSKILASIEENDVLTIELKITKHLKNEQRLTT